MSDSDRENVFKTVEDLNKDKLKKLNSVKLMLQTSENLTFGRDTIN